MADKLTIHQAQAVNDRGGPLLVSAAAGSGKTKVLVDRLLKYLTDPNDPADLDEFLIITYTKAAASELRGKIAAKLSERIAEEPENKHLQKQMQRLFLTKISTVHGFCGDILREYAYRLDLPADFRVADENECREIREMVLKDLLDKAYETGEIPGFLGFVSAQGLGRDDRMVPGIVERVYDSARCHLDPEAWLDNCAQAADAQQVTDAAQTVWGNYLLEELRDYLRAQMDVLRQCIRSGEEYGDLSKPLINLKDTYWQLERLYNSATWDEAVANSAIDYGRLNFPRKPENPELVERIKAARNGCKEGLAKMLDNFTDPSQQVLTDLRQCGDSTAGLIALVRAFDKAYTRAKTSRRCLDFTDLEQRTLDLLLGKRRTGATAAADEIGSRYREILVDEYQDSNGVQDAIFAALTRKKHNCFMVGDVKQSIYQFRLADPGIFLEKYREYLPAGEVEPGQGRKVLLSDNFRSGGEVVEAVNHVFRSCMSPRVGGLHYGEGEALREGIPHSAMPDSAVELHVLETGERSYVEESAFVAQRIRQMLDDGTPVRDKDGFRPVKPEDIVILLRSPGSVGAEFQTALERQGIRCSSGGGDDLLSTIEIATFRSLLQTVYNPRLDIPLIAAASSPLFGFTADDLAMIRSGRRGGAVYDAMLRSELPIVSEFVAVLKRLRETARMGTLTGLLEECMAVTRMDSVYAAMEGGDARVANLHTFFGMAAAFEAGGNGSLGRFLEHLDAMSVKGIAASENTSAGCVTIMSIHKSKGLEFPVVFVSNLARSFNRESLRAQVLCDKTLGLGMNVADTGKRIRYPSLAKRAIAAKMTRESLSEEMRVLYVALTRARDRLIMTYASKGLEKELKDIALRMDFDDGALICRDVNCPGEWVLAAAMRRSEAGELFALGGKPQSTAVSEIPWKITLSSRAEEGTAISVEEESQPELPAGTDMALRESLAFRYPHSAATQAPSKQTATQRKGREKDSEAAEAAKEPAKPHRMWRGPSFRNSSATGKDYGNAIHKAMQFICFEACTDHAAIRREIERLCAKGFLTKAEGEMVDCEVIARFFETDIGARLRGGCKHIREFKFSILDDAERYGDGLEGEKILLQGVVDCALVEEDGMTILDFKTDQVTEGTLAAAVERYRSQVETYGEAMERIYEMPVKQLYLYFFRLNRFVAL